MHSQMQSQMQSFDIERLTEQSNQARVSATLVDCPTAATATTTIPFSYFVPAILTDCSVSTVLSDCVGSVPLRDLLDNCSDQPVLGLTLF